MSAAPPSTPPASRSGASGSEKRQRGKVISVRVSPDEETALLAKAQAAGLSLGSYLRACALGEAGPRAKRSPPVNALLLAHAVAELNKAGSNLNQIARVVNTAGLFDPRDTSEVLDQVRGAVAEIRTAVGRKERA
jgi:hypothetical protein